MTFPPETRANARGIAAAEHSAAALHQVSSLRHYCNKLAVLLAGELVDLGWLLAPMLVILGPVFAAR